MRSFAVLFTLALLFSASSSAAQWSQNYDAELYGAVLSPDGKYLAITSEKNAVDVYDAAGKKLWSRPISSYSVYFNTMFTSKGTLLVGSDQFYYFHDAATGKELAKLPIKAESWEDLEMGISKDPEMDTLKPHFVNDVGIFYFDDAIQFVDLSNHKLIHSAEASPSEVKYETWEDLLMIKLSGTDTIYIVDTKNKAIALQFDAYDASPNQSLYQHMLVHNDQLLFLTESNMLSFDLKTKKRTAILDVDPDDPEVYMPVNAKDGFYLMVSVDEKQKLYDVKSGAQLWETKEGVVPGVVEQIHYLDDKDAVIHSYHDDGKIGLYRLAMKDGSVLWSQIVAEQDGDYVSGHKKGSKTMAFVTAVAMQMLQSALRGPSRARPGEFGTMNAHLDDMDRRRYQREDRERWASLRKSINKKQSSDGYAKVLEVNDKTITLLLAGKLYNTIKKSEQNEYDGEGILILDSKTGKVIKHENFAITAKNSDIKNVIDNLKTELVGDAYVTVGYNTVCVVRGDQVEEISFDKSALSYIVNDDKAVVFMVNENEDDEVYDYWHLDPSVNPSKRTLVARSIEKNVVFQNPTPVMASFNLTDEEIQAFDPILNAVNPGSFASPKWKLTEDEIGNLDVGNYSKARGSKDSVNGVRITSTGVYMLGSDKIGKISLDGKCKWAHEWDPNLLMNWMGATEVGNTIVYSTGDDCSIIKNDCAGGQIGKHEISFRYATILNNVAGNTVYFIDRDNGTINCYPTK